MAKKKNIILILSDQQRYDTISAYGLNDICKTPNIDALADEGMKFTNAFTSSPICAPSRASVMTGLYPHNHGVIDNFTDIKEDTPLLGQCMKDQGYYCGLAGKWHVSASKTPEDCGFNGKPFMGYGFPGSQVFPSLIFNQPPDNSPNYYEEYLKDNGFDIPDISNGFLGDNPALQVQEMYAKHEGPVESTIEYFVAHEANRLIDEAIEQDKPFLIWANFWGPHSPSIVPEPYYSMYDPKDIKEHPSYKENFEDKPYGYYLTEKMWGLGDYGWDGFADISAKYYGHCTMIDDMVGLIVDKLKKLGIYEDTIIIYSADHGDCLGAHKLIEKGAFTFDEIYRIPMIVKGLGNKDNDSFVYLQEIMPTLLDIAGIKPPKPVDGESLLPLMYGTEKSNNRTEVFGEFHNHFYVSRQRMVRDNKYQFTFNENEKGELYDFINDPYQLTNLCYDEKYADIKKEYIEKLSRHLKESNDPASVWFHRIKEFY
ncbi:sulfatase-like hydrolase/transferase [Romboutsia sp. 1001713B170131_170501_G6]|uniref:sulfatase-like hydrolase/transferase n=1 Tax=Romboutsia sp. 1001713B170131_170501_G6 TaxID=2787108 RepID=UPI0018A99E4F|nr:sulfatase-like hydrolase/transferase [Romboutsia sp. 1001713B170131_170501_G6]